MARLESSSIRQVLKTVWIIGGGWAGLSAAIELVDLGLKVRLIEAKKQLGGRARTVQLRSKEVDNGQHILLGAYKNTLSVMLRVGLKPDELLYRQRLDLRNAASKGFRLIGYQWLPVGIQFILGTIGCKGWSILDKFSLLMAAAKWVYSDFNCQQHLSVSDLCSGITNCVKNNFMSPLCLAVFNTPLELSSGSVFLRVLRDALLAHKGSSDLLIPRADMGELFPQAAQQWLNDRGCEITLAHRLKDCPLPKSSSLMDTGPDAVILACDAKSSARLVSSINEAWASQCSDLLHAAISTTYVHCTDPEFIKLERPIMMLEPSNAEDDFGEKTAQFVFDRGFLFQNHSNLIKAASNKKMLSFVSSYTSLPNELISAAVYDQARKELKLRDLEILGTVTDKSATFCCTPGTVRPGNKIIKNLWACGDYLEGPYPSTIEGAVMSGIQVAKMVAYDL